MTGSRFSLALASLIAVWLSGCRSNQPLRAHEVESGKLTLPEADISADHLQPGRLAAVRRYLGSVVLFRPDASAEGLARLIDAASETRLTKAAWLGFRKNELAPKAATRLALVDELSRVETEAASGENVRVARWAAATIWLEQFTDGTPRAEAALGAYCEAKIWELATTAKSLAALYLERPIPLAACEPHYAKAGLLGGEACGPAGSGPRNYAGCLWSEGVFKTRFFEGKFDAAKVEKLHSLLADGTLVGWFTGTRAPQARQAAMNLEKARVSSIFGAANKDVFVPETGTPVATPELAPDAATPAMMITAVEDGPASAAAPGLAPLADAERGEALAKALRPFAARDGGEPSVNDYLFTKAVPAWAEPVSYPVVRAEPAYAGMFAASDPAYGLELAELSAAVDTAAAVESAVRTAESGRFETFTAALRAGAEAATAPDVGMALWINASLTLEPAEDGSAHVALKLDDGANAIESASHDPETGILTVTAEVEEPLALGFGLAPQTEPGRGDPFCNLSAAALTGAKLSLALEPRKIGASFHFYSGVVKLTLADGTAYEGGSNLLGEESSLDQ